MEEKKMEEKRPEKKQPMCVNCGKRPAVISQKTGKPNNHLCRECFTEKLQEARARRLEAVDSKLELDLSEYPELMEKLCALAKTEIRPANMQALWILRKAIEEGGI